jgi:hypothetical protein
MKTADLILAQSESGIYGLLPYRSTFRTRAMGDTVGALAGQRVFRFKQRGESAEVWQRLIELAAGKLGCVEVWAVPGHDPNAENQLQRLFGTTIRRARTVEARKYNRKSPVEVGSMDFPERGASAGPVLLVDDVATSGGTLTAIRDHLATMGVEAVPLALGLNWRLVPKGFDVDSLSRQWEATADAVKGVYHGTNTERRQQRRTAGRTIERRKCADPARRKRLERNVAAWLQHYLAASFPLPFGDVHKEIIRAAVQAVKTGAGMAVAAPRGTGKTTILEGVALWAVLSGNARFPVVGGWTHGSAKKALRKWIRSLSENAAIADDYPEFTQPFELSTHSNKLRSMQWEDDQPCGADVRTVDGLLILPSGLGALGAVSIGGSVRGLNVGLADGSTIRPDLLLLDDPQDKPTAQSGALVRKTIELIESDFFSLAGPDSRLSVMAACTIIEQGDVATWLLDNPDFEAIRTAQITAWPNGFDDPKSETRKLWQAWNKTRLDGLADNDGGKAARAFYRTNKAQMTEGMAVSWQARFDKRRGDPDALYAAMLDYYRLGERAFMAERQNAPLQQGEASVFELPVSHVAHRVNGLERCVAPADAVAVVGMVDINADALRWALAAVSNARALSVIDYGTYPGGGNLLLTGRESEAVELMRGLSGLDKHLAGLTITRGGDPMRIDLMMMDVGFLMQPAFDFIRAAARVSRMPWQASRGWGSRTYRAGRNVIGTPGEGWHLSEWAGKGRAVSHDADLWRLRMQKGFLLPIGAPDSIAIYGNENQHHGILAAGVCAERLTAYAQTDAGPLYRWQMTPGERNDWCDVCTGLYVAAARAGLSPTGQTARAPKRYVEQRRCKVKREDF